MIDAPLSANDPLPLEPDPNDPKPDRAPLAHLADGSDVTLRPETAGTVEFWIALSAQRRGPNLRPLPMLARDAGGCCGTFTSLKYSTRDSFFACSELYSQIPSCRTEHP